MTGRNILRSASVDAYSCASGATRGFIDIGLAIRNILGNAGVDDRSSAFPRVAQATSPFSRTAVTFTDIGVAPRNVGRRSGVDGYSGAAITFTDIGVAH